MRGCTVGETKHTPGPYAAWIDAYIAERLPRCHPPEPRVAVLGSCASATEQMVKAFPELRRVAGFYGGREHWWCVAPDGTVVDPTAAQFDPGFAYEEYDAARHGPRRSGRCPECGDDVYEGADFCSPACLRRYGARLNAEAGLR